MKKFYEELTGFVGKMPENPEECAAVRSEKTFPEGKSQHPHQQIPHPEICTAKSEAAEEPTGQQAEGHK